MDEILKEVEHARMHWHGMPTMYHSIKDEYRNCMVMLVTADMKHERADRVEKRFKVISEELCDEEGLGEAIDNWNDDFCKRFDEALDHEMIGLDIEKHEYMIKLEVIN